MENSHRDTGLDSIFEGNQKLLEKHICPLHLAINLTTGSAGPNSSGTAAVPYGEIAHEPVYKGSPIRTSCIETIQHCIEFSWRQTAPNIRLGQ